MPHTHTWTRERARCARAVCGHAHIRESGSMRGVTDPHDGIESTLSTVALFSFPRNNKREKENL